VSIALHATPDNKATMREELSDVFRAQPVTPELAVVTTCVHVVVSAARKKNFEAISNDESLLWG
jgi:hypothetical protein